VRRVLRRGQFLVALLLRRLLLLLLHLLMPRHRQTSTSSSSSSSSTPSPSPSTAKWVWVISSRDKHRTIHTQKIIGRRIIHPTTALHFHFSISRPGTDVVYSRPGTDGVNGSMLIFSTITVRSRPFSGVLKNSRRSFKVQKRS